MFIGLRMDVYQHIREKRAGNLWSASEEVRFQFGFAATLVHELVHVSYWWVGNRCPYGEYNEPWWSKRAPKLEPDPELGIDWEGWAFGSRVPTTTRIRARKAENPPNLFTRGNWSHTYKTARGGRSSHDCVTHDFVFPVKWLNNWFREDTWTRIAANGREAGRPNHDSLVILSELGDYLGPPNKDDNSFKRFTCDLENYTHP
jgi:hypothetical protein